MEDGAPLRVLESFSEDAWAHGLDELSTYTVLEHMGAGELAAMRAVSREWSGAVTTNARRLFSGLAAHTLPQSVSAHLSSSAFARVPSFEARYNTWTRVCARAWALRGVDAPADALSPAPRLPRGPCRFSLSVSQQPNFCVTPLRSSSSRPAVLTAGGDGTVRIMRLERCPGRFGGEAAVAADATAEEHLDWSAWVRGVLWPTLRAAARRVDSPSLPAGEGAHGMRAVVSYEWLAHDGGMLGLSVDEPRGAPSTAITCAFDGSASYWRINYDELEHLDELPAKRLKALLTSRGVSCDDLLYKADFARRIKLLGLLPPATLIAHLEPHSRTVVCASHAGSIAVTVGHSGVAKVFTRLDAGPTAPACSSTPVRAARSITVNASGVDSCLLEMGHSRFLTGGKDGVVAGFDLETGQQMFAFESGSAWIWCLRSVGGAGVTAPAPWDSPPSEGAGVGAVDTSSSSAPGEGLFSCPHLFVTGDTAGLVRVWDSRMGGVACVHVLDGQVLPPDYLSQEEAMGGAMGEAAVAGMSLIPHDASFTTTGFDGVLRLWDARALTPRLVWALPPVEAVRPRAMLLGGASASREVRLARCALVAPDLIAAAAMDGSIRFWDMNWGRAACTE